MAVYRYRVVCYWPDGTEAGSAGRCRTQADAEREAVALRRTFPGWRVTVEVVEV